MKLLKKYPVAIIITALAIAASVWIGWMQMPNADNYLTWVRDDAGILSASTETTLARDNMKLEQTYGSVVAVDTFSDLNTTDLESYAYDLGNKIGLGQNDLLLVIDKGSQKWYVAYGNTIGKYITDSTLPDLFQQYINDQFFNGNYDSQMTALFTGLDNWYSNNVPSTGFGHNWVGLGIFGIVLAAILSNLWWIILLLIFLSILDRIRYRNYIARYPGMITPPILFQPLLFWHRPGTRWYRRMQNRPPPPPRSRGGRGPRGGGFGGGFFGGFGGP